MAKPSGSNPEVLSSNLSPFANIYVDRSLMVKPSIVTRKMAVQFRSVTPMRIRLEWLQQGLISP